MMEYDNLILKIAKEYKISKGDRESELSYISRVIYSLIARMGYASLWDTTTDSENTISIRHFKNRIVDVLKSYMDIFPQIISVFSNPEEIADEIYDIYLNAGCIYHSKYSAFPANESKAQNEKVIFTRGEGLSSDNYLCGIGTYRLQDNIIDGASSIINMFQLHEEVISNYWKRLTNNISWTYQDDVSKYEYLRLYQPFNYGYFENKPCEGKIQLARTRDKANRMYYLSMLKEKMALAPIPSWMSDNHEYRLYSNSCLMNNDSLPASKYRVDGTLVELRLGYLLPPAELNFVKLYSWPYSYNEIKSSVYRRFMTKKVFSSIKNVLETEGFVIEREK